MFIVLPKQRVQGTIFQLPKKKISAENNEVITDKGGGADASKARAKLSIFIFVEASGTTLSSEIFLFCDSHFNIVGLL